MGLQWGCRACARSAAAVAGLTIWLGGAHCAAAVDFYVDDVGQRHDGRGHGRGALGARCSTRPTVVAPGDRVIVRPGDLHGVLSRHERHGGPADRVLRRTGRAHQRSTTARRTTASISSARRTLSSTASPSPAWPGPACGRSASPATSPSSSPCATSTPTNNGTWGIFTGHVDDLLIENNHTCGLDRRARHLRLQQRRPARCFAATSRGATTAAAFT